MVTVGFPSGPAVKNPPANAEDAGSGRAPGEGNGNPLQYSHQGNPMDRGAWRAQTMDRRESDTTEQLTVPTAPPLKRTK